MNIPHYIKACILSFLFGASMILWQCDDAKRGLVVEREIVKQMNSNFMEMMK